MGSLYVGIGGGTMMSTAGVHRASVVRETAMFLVGHAVTASVARGDTAKAAAMSSLFAAVFRAQRQDLRRSMKGRRIDEWCVCAVVNLTFPRDATDVKRVH